jgi:hypothetical protein
MSEVDSSVVLIPRESGGRAVHAPCLMRGIAVSVTDLASARYGIAIKITINLLGARHFADMLRGCTLHLANRLST